MKLFTVVGARPNFIKIDPTLPQTIIHTGQHYDYEMSQQFFKELKLPKPKWNLGATRLDTMIARLIKLFGTEKPNMVMVIGDTNSSYAGAVAAAHCKIPLVHIESGMRSGNYLMPEEINRIIIDRIAKICFCPNTQAAMNLVREGKQDNVYVVGDPEFDAMGKMLPIPKGKRYKKFILLTIHRQANNEQKRLKNIFKAIQASKEPVVFPCHPRTQKTIKRFGIHIPSNVRLIRPQAYGKTLRLISDARKVITDSGGVQREAFWMNTPVIILRDETEWTEIVEKGTGILVTPEGLLDAMRNFKGKMVPPPQGGANKKIKEILFKYA